MPEQQQAGDASAAPSADVVLAREWGRLCWRQLAPEVQDRLLPVAPEWLRRDGGVVWCDPNSAPGEWHVGRVLTGVWRDDLDDGQRPLAVGETVPVTDQSVITHRPYVGRVVERDAVRVVVEIVGQPNDPTGWEWDALPGPRSIEDAP